MQPMNNLARDLEWMAPFTLLQARDLQMSVEPSVAVPQERQE